MEVPEAMVVSIQVEPQEMALSEEVMVPFEGEVIVRV